MALSIPADDAESSERALSWVHGFGRPNAPTDVSEVEDMLDKLSGQSSFDPSAAAGTAAAESTAGWPESVYWFVGTTNRAFGALAIGEWHPADRIHSVPKIDAAACPFDTGGLLTHPPKYDCGVQDHDERRAYVDRHLIPLDSWHADVTLTLTNAYHDFGDYVEGYPPTAPPTENAHGHFVDEVIDGRPWTWEVRVAKARSAQIARDAARLYWHHEADRLAVLAQARKAAHRLDEPAAVLGAVRAIATNSAVSPGADAHADVRTAIRSRAAAL